MSYDRRDDAFDFDRAYARDTDREPTYGTRPRRSLSASGTVRISYVCPSEVHEAMKLDGRFEQLPFANVARPYQLVERYKDEPGELLAVRNCRCGSTICKTVATDEAPDWLRILRDAGLI